MGVQPVICAGVDIEELLTRAAVQEGDTPLDAESDDECEPDFANLASDASASPTDPEPVCACSSAENPTDQAIYAVQTTPERGRTPLFQTSNSPPVSCGQKRERSFSPAPPRKKSKNARKHRKKTYTRAGQRERDGHIPRPKVVKRNVEAGSSIKTLLDSETLPAAHGAYVAKNTRESGAKKNYLPEDLDGMGLKEIPWDGL